MRNEKIFLSGYGLGFVAVFLFLMMVAALLFSISNHVWVNIFFGLP